MANSLLPKLLSHLYLIFTACDQNKQDWGKTHSKRFKTCSISDTQWLHNASPSSTHILSAINPCVCTAPKSRPLNLGSISRLFITTRNTRRIGVHHHHHHPPQTAKKVYMLSYTYTRVASGNTKVPLRQRNGSYLPTKRRYGWSLRDGSVVKSICCSCRGPRLDSQHPYDGSQTICDYSSKQSNVHYASADTRHACSV